jgi:hypothetical protein
VPGLLTLSGSAIPRVARDRVVKTRSRMAIFAVLSVIFAKPLMDWAVVRTYARNLSALRALAFAASSSRLLGAALVSSE